MRGITKKEKQILDKRIKDMVSDEYFKMECDNAKEEIIREITSDATHNIVHQLFTYVGTRLEHGELSRDTQNLAWSYIWKKVEKAVRQTIKW